MSVNKVQLANGETIIDISDSTVTPENLAEGVTAHDASGQKITGKMVPGGGSSVQSDWNQTDSSAADFIKNKPFGDYPSDTLKVSTNYEDMLVVGDFLFKVSDDVPTLDDFANGATISGLGGSIEIAPGGIVEFVDGIIGQEEGMVVVVSVAGAAFGDMIFPETGMYMARDILAVQPSLTIPGYTGFLAPKPIDEKYMGNAFIQYDKFIYLSSGGADPTKKFMLWVNDRGEVQVTALS